MFDRLLKIINKDDFKKIQNIKVLIVGIGGVGGYSLETLVRLGVLNITIVDKDIIDITNLNRQIISNTTNIGEKKVDIAKKRCLEINPNININTIDKFILDNIDELNIKDYDYIIDACDTITTKLELIKEANKYSKKIISCMGTGNRIDPTKLEITDIFKTNNDPVCKIMRKLLKENNIKKQQVVYSKEIPIKTDRTPGSTSLVPSVAGIYCTYYIINDVINKR